MTLRASTGLRNKLLGTDDFQATFAGCFINIYAGSQPATADDATTATLLTTIYSDGVALGLNFDAPIAGVINKASAQTWSGTAITDGTAGWFRLYEAADNPANATTANARIDGTVAVSGGDLNISSTSIVNGAVQTITSASLTMPAS